MCLALLVSLNMCLRQQQLESLYKPLRYVINVVVSRFIISLNSYDAIVTFSGSQPSAALFFGVTNA